MYGAELQSSGAIVILYDLDNNNNNNIIIIMMTTLAFMLVVGCVDIYRTMYILVEYTADREIQNVHKARISVRILPHSKEHHHRQCCLQRLMEHQQQLQQQRMKFWYTLTLSNPNKRTSSTLNNSTSLTSVRDRLLWQRTAVPSALYRLAVFCVCMTLLSSCNSSTESLRTPVRRQKVFRFWAQLAMK